MPTPVPVRVLVADDSDLLRRLLCDASGEVDGVAALDGVAAHRPGVVVLDLQMPVVGGLAALQTLRAGGRTPRVIVLTNHADAVYREACLEAGADHFFDKSSEFERVLEVLRQWAGTAEA